jgi:hypothetical protein
VEISLSTSSPTQSAMDRGVGFWKILAWTGILLAGALYVVDPLEPLAYFAAPICFLADEYVEPGPFVENLAGRSTGIVPSRPSNPCLPT